MSRRTGVGETLAKTGVALMMRRADGEENLTPFCSLGGLLSATKPILRAAARNPDAVFFSIQPVDLASVESEVAYTGIEAVNFDLWQHRPAALIRSSGSIVHILEVGQ